MLDIHELLQSTLSDSDKPSQSPFLMYRVIPKSIDMSALLNVINRHQMISIPIHRTVKKLSNEFLDNI